MPEGKIIKSTGSWYNVMLPDQEVVPCRVKGKLRVNDNRLTNPIAVGDFVTFQMEEQGGVGIISSVQKRQNYVIRSSPRKKHQLHLIACNVDQVFIITTIREPDLKPGFLDRFLLTTETYQIPTYLIFNKSDIWEKEDFELFETVKDIYEKVGYACIYTSATNMTNVEELNGLLMGKTTLFSGHSGVGKSSLMNTILPNSDIKTTELSGHTGKGQHTTTFAEMYALNHDTYIIDTPGIKELGFINLDPKDVAGNFKEIFAMSSKCKFNNCMHQNEPNCAVKEAVSIGMISDLRYSSYLSVLEEVQEQNSWERKTDW